MGSKTENETDRLTQSGKHHAGKHVSSTGKPLCLLGLNASSVSRRNCRDTDPYVRWFRGPGELILPATRFTSFFVDVFTVSDFDDLDQNGVIVNPVDHLIIANANSVCRLAS